MIDVTFQSLFQVRFETLAHHEPEFTKVSDRPLEYDFTGGAIGLLQTYPLEDFRHSVQIKCVLNSKHWVYVGGAWSKVNSQTLYEVQNYDYIWFSSANSNNLKITEVNYV